MALKVKAIVVSPIPWWVKRYAYLVGPYLDGGYRTYHHRLAVLSCL
jgi:hypothetical protein